MMYWKGKLLCGGMPFSYSLLFLFPSNNLFPPFITPFCNSFSLSHTPPPAISLFLIHFSCFNLFSLLHLQWFTVTCPPPRPILWVHYEILSLFRCPCLSPSLCHIIYSSHPCCSRSLLSLSWAIHLSLHFSPIKHHPSINLLSIPLFKVIARSLSLSLPLLLSPLCSNCLCDPWYMPLSLKKP